jgi:hypothetical protein
MAVQGIALAAFAVVAMVCGIWSSVILMQMVDEVNVHLPESQRFALEGWHPWKSARLLREYRRFCPAGRSIARLRNLWLAMVLSMSLAAFVLQGPGAAGFFAVAGCTIAWIWYAR